MDEPINLEGDSFDTKANKIVDSWVVQNDVKLAGYQLANLAQDIAAGLRETEREALERAAQVADEYAKQNHAGAVKAARNSDYVGHDVLASCQHEAEACAYAIRALMEEQG